MELRLPELSEKNNETILTLWHVAESERVSTGQDIVEIATDKATFDIPAPCSGTLIKKHKTEGEKVAPNGMIAEIREDGS
ncbi:MAG: lipoyl domain-containing protein [Candidatus Omnitrophica bacterium]|nr:lipoyl domain-containing protein [Candidatus Omnitrophota bacterium]